MWYIGIDLHRETVVFAAVNDAGEVRPPVRLPCSEVTRIVAAFDQLRPFRAVVEATRAYRWLYQALTQFEVQTLPRLDHLIQTCKSGAMSEYDKIDETFSPTALEIVGDWVTAQLGK